MSKSEAWSLAGIIVVLAFFLSQVVVKTQQIFNRQANMTNVKIIQVTDAYQRQNLVVRGPTDVVSLSCRRELRPGDRLCDEVVTFCGDVRFLNAWAKSYGFQARCLSLDINLDEVRITDWRAQSLYEEFGNPFIEDEPSREEVIVLFPPQDNSEWVIQSVED